jgi:hypothetical protein
MKIYFYIIQRNGMIHEIENIGDRFKSSFEQWQKGGLIIFPSLGMGINAVDITNILNDEKYETYINTVQPKLFIRDGTWRDGKERQVVRYEKWKQDEIAANKKLELSEPKNMQTTEETKALFAKYRPEFMKHAKI